MKVSVVLKNVIDAVPVRVLILKLACGHRNKVTQMSIHMKIPTHMKCQVCSRGWPEVDVTDTRAAR